MVLELEKYNTWEERYNIFAKQFLNMNTSVSPANLKTICTTAYKYLSAILYYDSSTLSINSPIILLKSTYPLNMSAIEEDYGLHKVFLISCSNICFIVTTQIRNFSNKIYNYSR